MISVNDEVQKEIRELSTEVLSHVPRAIRKKFAPALETILRGGIVIGARILADRLMDESRPTISEAMSEIVLACEQSNGRH